MLDNPDLPKMEKFSLCFTDDEAGKQAANDAVARLKAAVAAGTFPDDFDVSKETIERQDRARTRLWKADNSNFEDLKNVKVPVLVTDGRSDAIDPPKNSLMIANQIPFSWLAYFEGGHAFVFQSFKQLAAMVNVFVKESLRLIHEKKRVRRLGFFIKNKMKRSVPRIIAFGLAEGL
jgi:pimeloyl-ACP methyl ester carboxylesterase